MKGRVRNILVAFDIFVFSLITFGGSKRNESMSGAAYRLEQKGRWQGRIFRPLIDWAFSWAEADHCYKSWLSDNRSELWNGSNCG